MNGSESRSDCECCMKSSHIYGDTDSMYCMKDLNSAMYPDAKIRANACASLQQALQSPLPHPDYIGFLPLGGKLIYQTKVTDLSEEDLMDIPPLVAGDPLI